MDLTPQHYRAYIFIEINRNKSASEIIQQLKDTALPNIPADSTVFQWARQFKSGKRDQLADLPRSGRPSTSNSVINIERIQLILEEENRVSTRCIAEQINLSHETVRKILKDDMGLRKLCSQWVPHHLSHQNKLDRVECAKNILQMRDQHSMEEILKFFTVEDESWVLFDTPLTKNQNKCWVLPDSCRRQVVRPTLTNKKTMIVLCFTGDGKIYVELLAPGETLTSEKYVHFLRTVGERWRTLKSSPTRLCCLWLMHDNARPHSAASTRDFLSYRKVKVIKQSPYSPDLNLCDRWIFREHKEHLRKFKFSNQEEVKEETLRWFRSIPKSRFEKEILHLFQHCENVILKEGDYIT